MNKQTKTILGVTAVVLVGYYVYTQMQKKKAPAAPAAPATATTATTEQPAPAAPVSFAGEVGKRVKADGGFETSANKPVFMKNADGSVAKSFFTVKDSNFR
jgi:hypothetical protein